MLAHKVQTLTRLVRACPLRVVPALLDARIISEVMAPGSSSALEVRTRTAGPLRLASAHDLPELREIVVSNMYCAPGFLPRSGWVVADVGANLGFFTAWALSFMRRGVVVAIEPVPETFALLRSNLDRGSRRRPGPLARPVHSAAAARNQSLEFLVPRGPEGWSSAIGGSCLATGPMAPALRAMGAVQSVRVQGQPLDDILAEAIGLGAPGIDLLKCDVEGMEAECLEGATAALSVTRRVVFEYHGAAQLARCARILGAAGFREVLRRTPYGAEIALSFWRR